MTGTFSDGRPTLSAYLRVGRSAIRSTGRTAPTHQRLVPEPGSNGVTMTNRTKLGKDNWYLYDRLSSLSPYRFYAPEMAEAQLSTDVRRDLDLFLQAAGRGIRPPAPRRSRFSFVSSDGGVREFHVRRSAGTAFMLVPADLVTLSSGPTRQRLRVRADSCTGRRGPSCLKMTPIRSQRR
jgi:hypothetical protein